MEEKPFVFGTAVSGENFTDRGKHLIVISRKKVTIPDPTFREWLRQNLNI